MTDQREDVLRKIRALLAKANDPGVTEEEADAFRQGADRMMAKYAVEEMELKPGEDPAAIGARDVDMNWFAEYSMFDKDVANALWATFLDVYSHCRCRVLVHTYTGRSLKVAGFGSDLDYADLLFTSLMLQMSSKVMPDVDRKMDWYGNAVKMRQAGMNWDKIISLLAAAGILPEPYAADPYSKKTYHGFSNAVKRRYGQRFASNPATYRRSFSIGFAGAIGRRLAEMRAKQSSESEGVGESGALVLADRKTRVDHWANDNYPVPANRRRNTYRRDTRKLDGNAYHNGVEAGNRANISARPGQGLGGEQVRGLNW